MGVTIGLYRPKYAVNVASAMRAAGCWGANAVLVEGERYTRCKGLGGLGADPACNWRSIPLINVQSLVDSRPYKAVPIAVELTDNAEPLANFVHPQHAFYIFGPEDGSVPLSVAKTCAAVISIPSNGCLNLAATVNVVLYDRKLKQGVKE